MTEIQKKNLTTDALLKRLHSADSVAKLSEYNSQLPLHSGCKTLSDYFIQYMRLHDIQESELILASQIQRNYAYQILNGTKNPGRDKVLALCLAAKMDYAETQRALALANLGKLYPRRKRDSIVIFALDQKLSVQQTNELLYEEKENVLE